MEKEKLTEKTLIKSALDFCKKESGIYKKELYGVTDGKAIGTIVEHDFQNFLSNNYNLNVGSSAKGLDLPSINTDIKVTSIKQPQSSCPFRDSKQKIYGLGYNLILFVYEKKDDLNSQTGCLNFVSCSYISLDRTADYQTTYGLLELIKNDANEDDIFAFLEDHRIPSDEVTLRNMAKDILKNPPKLGYLTISNALQWRLQYKRVVNLKKSVTGIKKII